MRRLAVLALALIVPFASVAQTAAPAGDLRTFFETLDMATPEGAVRQFIDAFGRSDFVVAFFLLSPDAKRGFVTAIETYNEAALFLPAADGAFLGARVLPGETHPDVMWDLSTDAASLFNAYLALARETGRMPFDLSGARLVAKASRTRRWRSPPPAGRPRGSPSRRSACRPGTGAWTGSAGTARMPGAGRGDSRGRTRRCMRLAPRRRLAHMQGSESGIPDVPVLHSPARPIAGELHRPAARW